MLRNEAFGRGKQATLRAIEQLGYTQIDTISVVERAHHHVLWSRVPNYQPKFLDQLVRERKVFEYWFHAASWLPMRDYRFALPRMTQMHGERGWFKNCDKNLIRDILRRIEIEGPLRARDFEDTRESRSGWWDWKPAKQALEQLFMQGELMVSSRNGFQKVYDLPQRVLPEWVDTSQPDSDEYATHLIDNSLKANGFSALKSFSYLRKGRQLRDSIKSLIDYRIETGQLVSFKLGKNFYYINPELLETRAPRSNTQVKILSPFDNSVIQRDRGRDIFEFDYQIECYVPEPKRQFGYFCLPLLFRDQFVGRMDCKAHRAKSLLQVKLLHLEKHLHDDFIPASCRALTEFAQFNNCDEIQIDNPRNNLMVQKLNSCLQAS